MKWLAAIGAFVGEILKHVLPDLLSKWQQPSETTPVGNTEELNDAINDSIMDDQGDDIDPPPPRGGRRL